MKFARNVFLFAGIYGILVLTPLYFLEGEIGRRTPPAISHPEYFYGFIGVGLAWQILFLLLAHDPVRYRLMMLPAILEKISYGLALVALLAQGRVPLSIFALGSLDWVFAFLFVAAFAKTPARAEPAAQ
jgi:hypothetical protein